MIIKKEQLKEFSNSNIAKLLSEPEYLLVKKNAIQLLSPDRIDILIKLIYATTYLLNKKNSFIKELYLEHIKAFNHFVEADNSNKIGKNDFINSFKALIDSIKNNGLSHTYIPLNTNQIPLDGAHRIATAIALNTKIYTFNIKNKNNSIYNYRFFIDRELDETFLNYTAIEYAKLKNNCFMVLIWPKAKNHELELMHIMNNYGKIIHFKKSKISYNGLINLQILAYKNEPWLGGYQNDFEGAHTKSSQCYDEDGYLRAFLFEPNITTDLIKMKDDIRSVFKIEKHAVHINDTHEETLEIANEIFNNNNFHRLNCSYRKEFKNFNRLFNEFKQYLNKQQIDPNNVAIIGGVLALYGVKEVKDLDYISTDKLPDSITDEIEYEFKKTKYTDYTIEQMINDPRLYLVFQNIKFINLNVLIEIKQNRNNDNDKYDVIIMKKLIDSMDIHFSIVEKLKLFFSISFYRRKIKLVLLKLRYIVYKELSFKEK